MRVLRCPGNRRVTRALLAIFAGIAVASPHAAVVEFDLGHAFVSVTPGDNSPTVQDLPIGTLRFEDVSPQQVLFTFSAHLLDPREFFQRVVFNGAWSHPDYIAFSVTNRSGSFADPSFGRSSNGSGTAPPAGFDFNLTFGNPYFDGTDSITYLLTCTNPAACGSGATGAGNNTLDATDFNATNADASGNPGYGGWYAMGNISYPGTDHNGTRYGDNVGGDNLVRAVPEPSGPGLLLVGLATLALAGRGRRAMPFRPQPPAAIR